MTISPRYFEVFKIPIKRGRTFEERDDATAPTVVIINETMARQNWGDDWRQKDILSERLTIGRGIMREFAQEQDRQIIGIVGDTRNGGLDDEPGPMMFIPQAQVPDAVNVLNLRLSPMAWLIRTQTEPLTMSNAIQEQLRQSTGLPVSDVRSMAEVVSRSVSRQKFNMWLMTVFGCSALLLAAIGIYGLMAYSVEQRTQEIGIRLALGAQGSQVKHMIVRQGMVLAIVGVAIGLGAAFWLSRFISSFLFGVNKWDPMVFVAVPATLALRRADCGVAAGATGESRRSDHRAALRVSQAGGTLLSYQRVTAPPAGMTTRRRDAPRNASPSLTCDNPQRSQPRDYATADSAQSSCRCLPDVSSD